MFKKGTNKDLWICPFLSYIQSQTVCNHLFICLTLLDYNHSDCLIDRQYTHLCVCVCVCMYVHKWNRSLILCTQQQQRKHVHIPTSSMSMHTAFSSFYCGAYSPRPCAIHAGLSELTSKPLLPSISISLTSVSQCLLLQQSSWEFNAEFNITLYDFYSVMSSGKKACTR